MSDLPRAVQAEIDAYTPAAAPPFDALAGRKRSRDRRRLAAGGAALSAVAVAAAAAVLAPSLGGGPDRPSSYAGPAGGTATTTIDVRFGATGDGDQAAVEECVGRPVLAKLSSPPVYATTLTAAPERTRTVVDCLKRLPGVASVKAVEAADEPGPAVIAWTGATVCLISDGLEDGPCRDLGAPEARALQAVLDRAVLSNSVGSTDCGPHGRAYRILFQHPAVRTAPSVVPLDCGLVIRGGNVGGNYWLDARSRDQVKQAYDRALPARTAAFLERCAGDGQPDLAPQFLGLTEDGLRARLGDDAGWRLVGRDGECLVRADDLRPERVNVLVEDGRVVWAARF